MPKQLDNEDREFFSLLSETIFSNPFEGVAGRVEKFTGKTFRTSGQHQYAGLVPMLDERLTRLEGNGIRSIHDLQGEDRKQLENALLFLVYDRYHDEFDALIEQQGQTGDEPVPVPFAENLLFDLNAFGFNQKDALRYLALFYQLRRAYYFIDTALVGEAPCMTTLRRSLWNNVFTQDMRIYGDLLWDRMEDFATLILGETGTGKGTAAAAIGRAGLIPFDARAGRFTSSFTGNFVATNLSQFPESLIESELFGHRKGAFTGAIDHHQGLFERCRQHGTLFLDEIGDLSVPVQIKLLKVLEDRCFTPVGSHQVKRFAGRIIAATHRPVHDLLEEGKFREDFYYRLSSDVIQVPSLRQRIQENPDELNRLTQLILQRHLHRVGGNMAASLEDRVMQALKRDLPKDYHWPGNVRELEQMVRSILLNGRCQPARQMKDQNEHWLAQARVGDLSAQQLLQHYCRQLHEQLGTYQAVAERTGLDRRTVKKYIDG